MHDKKRSTPMMASSGAYAAALAADAAGRPRPKLNERPKMGPAIIPPTKELGAFVSGEVILLLQIEKRVTETLDRYKPINGERAPAYIGMMTKEIYRKYSGTLTTSKNT